MTGREEDDVSERKLDQHQVDLLLVGDQQDNLLSLESVLASPGYRLIQAHSGKEALRYLQEYEPALILMDVQMPGLDVFATVTLVKNDERTRDIPIIFITAIGQDERFITKGYEHGAVDYIYKPYDPYVLKAKVAIFAELARKNRRLIEAERLLRDTERRERERQLAQLELRALRREFEAQKQVEQSLKAATRLRDEFLSIASHELRTPLTPIMIQTQGLERILDRQGIKAVTEEKLRKTLQSTSRQLNRLTRLIDNLLDISRITNGRLSLHREEFDLQVMIRDLIDRFHTELNQVHCRVNLQGIRSVQVSWDQLRIEQVLANLLTNAMKFSPGTEIHIECDEQDNQVILRVRDEGVGIAKKDQHRIFERFESAVSGNHFGGLGLGLYISRQIVQAHGGTIQVASELGCGSTFTIILPIQAMDIRLPGPAKSTIEKTEVRSLA